MVNKKYFTETVDQNNNRNGYGVEIAESAQKWPKTTSSRTTGFQNRVKSAVKMFFSSFSYGYVFTHVYGKSWFDNLW